MDNKQLKNLKGLLEQFNREYELDSMTQYVYIPYTLRKVKELIKD